MLSINDLVSANGISVTINAADLKEFALQLIVEAKALAAAELKAQQSEKYISRKEAAEMLQVDLSTLNRWNKSGYLCTIKVGGKTRYKLSEVLLRKKGDNYGQRSKF